MTDYIFGVKKHVQILWMELCQNVYHNNRKPMNRGQQQPDKVRETVDSEYALRSTGA